VRDRLPEKLRSVVTARMRRAYRAESALAAEAELTALAAELDRTHPGAAASLREGLDETLMMLRPGVPPTLARTLRSTNAIESRSAFVVIAARTSSAGAMGRWRCAGAPPAWSRRASSSAVSTATCTCGRCAPRWNGMSLPKMPSPTATMTP
jgi:Transposase, Mutator family